MLIANDKPMPELFKCSIGKGCGFISPVKARMEAHEKTSHVTKIKSIQIKKGDPESMLEYGVRMGFIPTKFANYRQKYLCVFDIECFERNYSGKREGIDVYIEKEQQLASLAVGSNLPGTEPTFYCRKSSKPEDEEELISRFVTHLEELHETLLQNLPRWVIFYKNIL